MMSARKYLAQLRKHHSNLEQLESSQPKSNEKPKAPGTPLWPDWTGATVACVASGPSLTVDDIALLEQNPDIPIIAINEVGLRRFLPLALPDADILYAADRKWWSYYEDDLDKNPMTYQSRVCGDENVTGTQFLKCLARGEKMPRKPGRVVSAGHSGFQALGLALTLGASRILLFGYDCGGPARNCHAERPEHFQNKAPFAKWAKSYDRVPGEWPDVEIINCSEHTQIKAFPIKPASEVLKC